MEGGTTPLRWPEFRPEERQERLTRTNITFIEYRPEKEPRVTPIKEHTVLDDTLKGLVSEGSDPAPLRLFIVEDLSQRVIELLGTRFDIDPLFFREQIDDYVWHNLRDPWMNPPSLTSSTKQRSWFRLRNMRLRYHKTEASYGDTRLEANQWNVLRRPDNDSNHWAHMDEVARDENGAIVSKAVVSILRTRTTIWIGKDKKCGNGTVGIVLLDPTAREGRPLWYDRSNWLPTPGMDKEPPPMSEETQPLSETPKTWYNDIVSMTAAYPFLNSCSIMTGNIG